MSFLFLTLLLRDCVSLMLICCSVLLHFTFQLEIALSFHLLEVSNCSFLIYTILILLSIWIPLFFLNFTHKLFYGKYEQNSNFSAFQIMARSCAWMILKIGLSVSSTKKIRKLKVEIHYYAYEICRHTFSYSPYWENT